MTIVAAGSVLLSKVTRMPLSPDMDARAGPTDAEAPLVSLPLAASWAVLPIVTILACKPPRKPGDEYACGTAQPIWQHRALPALRSWWAGRRFHPFAEDFADAALQASERAPDCWRHLTCPRRGGAGREKGRKKPALQFPEACRLGKTETNGKNEIGFKRHGGLLGDQAGTRPLYMESKRGNTSRGMPQRGLYIRNRDKSGNHEIGGDRPGTRAGD